MIKIVSPELELVYFTNQELASIGLIKSLLAENPGNQYFGDLETLIRNLDNGYLIYIERDIEPIGFISISKTNELALFIKNKYQINGWGYKSMLLLATVDRRPFHYYIDTENTVAESLARKFPHFQLSRL